MSSTYRILCLSHDPAITLEAEWQSGAGGRETAEAIAANPGEHKETVDHVGCDLLIGRYSYPLVEVGCPGQPVHGKPRHHPWHPRAHWTDVTWLRLAAAAIGLYEPTVEIADALKGIAGCWSPERLRRLRNELRTGE